MAEDVPAFLPEGYRALHKLGSGQTSHVFLAEHPRLGRVALKLPREELAQRPVLRRMFENEVQITLALKNLNVVGAFAGFPTGPKAFLALEYCSGGTLDQLLLERGQLPLEESARLVLEVALGLEYAHGGQVLHRDVKPANVFLTGEGRAKLGDFGTGIFLGDEGGERVGTAFYMAPEIFEGAAASVRSDVYSLGILAYEVLAGTRPFLGDSYDDLMLAHLSAFPKPLAHHRKDLPRGAAQVVATAMARDPSRRYPGVSEFRRAFAAALGLEEREEERSQPATGRASRRNPATARTEEGKGRQGGRGGLFGWLRRRRNE